MKLKDAIEMHEGTKTSELSANHNYLGIKCGELLLTPEIIESADWGFVIENTDPEFAKVMKGLHESLKENGPIIDIKQGLRLVDKP